MTLGIVALITLVLVIVISIWRGFNLGVTAIAATLVLCMISGISTSGALRAFDGRLVAQIAFSAAAFGALNLTDAASLLIKKIMKKLGPKAIPVMPWFFFLLAFIPAMLGAARPAFVPTIATGAMVGVQLGLHPLLIPFMVMIPSVISPIHPIQVVGIIANDLLEIEGQGAAMYPAFYTEVVIGIIVCAVLYVVLKGYKVSKDANIDFSEELPKFNKNQWITLLGTVVAIVGMVALKLEIGMVSAVMITAYFAFGIFNMKSFFKIIPLDIMFTVAGMGVLVPIVTELGGIDVLMMMLNPILNKYTIVPIVCFVAGLVSWLSSTASVVLPTFIPLLPGMVAAVGGEVSFTTVVAALFAGSHFSSLNPYDGMGAHAPTYLTPVIGEEEVKKLMPKQLILTFAIMGFTILLSAFGVVDLIASFFS